MTTAPDSAAEVATQLLEITGEALLSGAFDRFAECFRLPQVVATMDGARVLRTRDDLRRVFDEVRGLYAELGVARLDRWVEAALFDGPDRIRQAHVTHLLSKEGALLRPPFTDLAEIVREDGRWQVVGNQYTVETDTDHGRALLSAGVRPEAEAGPDSPAAAVFQGILDRVTRAFLTGDFETMFAAVQLPLFVQASQGTRVFATRDEVEADFRRYVTEFRVHGVTDAVRKVTSAEMVGARRITGGYRTHILSGAQLVVPAYKSAMTVEQGDDLAWRMTSIIHPMGHLTLTDKSEARNLPCPGDGRS
ncbi:hypothetical protein [Maliponia aquimaris]|uniref:SnoaL-like domain protein n=1 Tax=Maliponia aquimaris TaxID=1673631 RepID=A0A238KTK5_9RHOB|nr:hypothetical protein [Maliponia aquimaris]SMX46163.1 hypothetical protein MAA8898_03345 [Maliponia aquimaris]